MEILWSLGHRKTKAVEKNLYSNQLVQRVVESLTNGSAIEDWLVWHAGWPKWKNLTEIAELMTEVQLLEKLSSQPANSPIPELPDYQEPAKILPIIPQETKTKTEITHEEKRQFERVEARFRCIIKSTTLTFRTFTKNVSLGGVALEDTIPSELLGSECTIYITSTNNKKKKNLKFKVRVTQRPGAKFFSFENSDQAFMAELNQWLKKAS
jgi:hypothetical protein